MPRRWSGKVAWKDDRHFLFQAMGGGPGDPGLVFQQVSGCSSRRAARPSGTLIGNLVAAFILVTRTTSSGRVGSTKSQQSGPGQVEPPAM